MVTVCGKPKRAIQEKQKASMHAEAAMLFRGTASSQRVVRSTIVIMYTKPKMTQKVHPYNRELHCRQKKVPTEGSPVEE